MLERDRIKTMYKKLSSSAWAKRWTYLNDTALHIYQERERLILRTIKKYGHSDIRSKVILDIGCGNGWMLQEFVKYGADPTKLHGIDIRDEAIHSAVFNGKFGHNIHFLMADALNIPYADSVFDVILVFTLFSSIPNISQRYGIAIEIMRVLKPGGIAIVYDMNANVKNPLKRIPLIRRMFSHNPNMKIITKKEMKDMFSKCNLEFKTLTTHWYLLAPVLRFSRFIAVILDMIPLLQTHYLITIRKPTEGEK